MSQEAAARALGVSSQTVYRWESGSPIKDRDLAALEQLYGVDLGAPRPVDKRSDKKVPRGTQNRQPPHYVPSGELPRQVRLMALDFEREALAAGADDVFLRYVRGSLNDPDFTALFAGGPDESPMTEEEQHEEMEAVVAEMRALLQIRMRHARERGTRMSRVNNRE